MNDGQNSIVDTLILEYMGLFKILNPHVLKLYDINLYKLGAKIEIIILSITLIFATFSIYYSLNDVNVFIPYLMLLVAWADLGLNHLYLIKYSDTIWDLMRITNINFLYSKISTKENMFNAQRFKYKMATTISLTLIFVICISWIILPLFLRDDYLIVNFKNELYHYHCTPINYILPINDDFFNKHSNVFYAIETIMIVCAGHISIFFDFSVITMCTSIECQLKAVGNLYSTFSFADAHATSKQYL